MLTKFVFLRVPIAKKMAYQHVQDRFQLQMRNMEEFICKDNPVRFIDAFVAQLELARLGFLVSAVKIEGRPAFDPKVFLKLYFYGYLNGLRSSRKLEKETIRNVDYIGFWAALAPMTIALPISEKSIPKATFFSSIRAILR